MSSPYAVTLSQFRFGDVCAEYLLATESQAVGLRIYPADMADSLVARRELLDTHEARLMPRGTPLGRAWHVESLVQVKLAGDAASGYSQGLTLRNSDTVASLRYAGQEVLEGEGQTEIVTTLRSDRGYACEHRLVHREGDAALTAQTVFINEGHEPLSLELLASFSLSGITPFAEDDAPNRLHVHRFRSAWSAEGRHVCQSVEQLGLERSWSGHAVRAERFGQVGSLPARGYFPFLAVEDRAAGVFWGAQLAWAGSWQMEAYRKDDQLCISGGLADRELGHWVKQVAPGESFAGPRAVVTSVRGDLDDLCQRLTAMQLRAAQGASASEQALPVLANEWCTTWGNPAHNRLVTLAEHLRGSGARYLVIDAGWYKPNEGNWYASQGEWTPNRSLFPEGIAATAAAIRDRGLIPGIWFEFEVVGKDSPLYEAMAEHFLRRDGAVVTAGQRHFWDFRDPWVHDYLHEKVTALLRDAGFGYIKVDYNETIGIGVDGTESLGEESLGEGSLGEGLRQHILGVQEFFRALRRELPDLVIEVCASGGQRLEPSMLGLASMGSFSDAHESLEIPIIAANLHRLILPRQSQIRAVLHAADTRQRLAYSLAAGMLGRLCLSGELDLLDAGQWELVQEAIRFYERVAPIIADGRSRLYQQISPAWRHPQGAQAVVRTSADGSEALVVAHTFAAPLPAGITVTLPEGEWEVAAAYPAGAALPGLSNNRLEFVPAGEFEALALHLTRRS